MAKQKKIKLREQQKIVPFIMAILKGANINERWKGSALVTQYFEDLCRCTCDFFHPNHTSYQTKLQKVKCLIFFGADTGEIFEEKIYKKLLFSLNADLVQLISMISCISLSKKLSGYRRALLKAFQQELQKASQAISDFSQIKRDEKSRADVCELFWNDMGYSHPLDYDSTVISAIVKLSLLTALLKSPYARLEITDWRYAALQTLRQLIKNVNEFITETDLTANMQEMPDWTKISKAYTDKLAEIAKPQAKREITEEDIAYLCDINDLLDADFGSEEVDGTE